MEPQRRNNIMKPDAGKLLPLAAAIALAVPLLTSVAGGWAEYASGHESQGFFSFLSFRYSSTFTIACDLIFALTAAAIIFIVKKVQNTIASSKMFVEMATAANSPVFLTDTRGNLMWTNLGSIDKFSGESPEAAIATITGSQESRAAIEACKQGNGSSSCEIEAEIGGYKYWLHITFTKIIRKSQELICCTISDISNLKEANEKIANQQRELQMQNDMFILITAQQEVQRAGIKEQNDLLQEQRETLESQAQKLKEAFSELEYRNRQIITKTRYITDSIKAAQNIQEAMLPDEQQMNGFFRNFVIFRPKDIVSGDFYWLAQKNGFIFVVLGDCTGHGVPGACMSMIGIRILGELITEQKCASPSEILNSLHKKIQASLKQDITENNDGMDIAICRLEQASDGTGQWNLRYAGAKQPIYIVRKGSKDPEAEQVDCDRKSIGGGTLASDFSYTDKDLRLCNGDRIYLTSDGIKDQNNAVQKKFGSSRLRKAIMLTQTDDIRDQRFFISCMIRNWQGLEEQRDDISLWGFELSEHPAQPAT